jgi:DinB superfamily
VTNPVSVLLVELLMSVDRMIESSKSATQVAGEWPPATILGHVSQVDEQVWSVRIDQMVQAHRDGSAVPTYVWWKPNAEQTAAAFEGSTLDDAAGLVMASRISILTKLRDLADEDWDARAIHATFGEIDVRGLVLEILAHDEEHRASLVYSAVN